MPSNTLSAPTLNASTIANPTPSTPLPKIRLRQDLQFFRRGLRLEDYWVVKDPVSFEHFMFSSREFELLKLFDGRRSDVEVQQIFQSRFATRSLSLDQIRDFSARLIRDHLVSVEQLGYGRALVQNDQAKRSQGVKAIFYSPLAIRFRGVHPGWILDSFSWLGGLLFHRVTVTLSMIFSVLVLAWMLGHFDHVAARLPTISQILSTRGLLLMAVTLSGIKVLHELGHAMACRRCGGECFEIGVILLAFIPTLYCNVSDAWTFPEKWKRLLVSFGGIYIEILLATAAAIVWMNTGPGLLNAIMFNIVLLSSINTLLINGNPLLRYDGYYLLSDLTEHPNLGRQSQEAFRHLIASLFMVPSRQRNDSTGLLIYAVLSFLYRWFVVISIVVVVYLTLKAVGLKLLGRYIVAFLVLSMVVRPAMNQIATFRRNRTRPTVSGGRAVRRDGQFSFSRSIVTTVILASLIAFAVLVPLPSYIRCNLIVEARDPTPVYVPADGRLTEIAEKNQPVTRGDVIARISSLKLQQELRLARNEIRRFENFLQELTVRVNEDPLVAPLIAETQKDIEAAQSRLQLIQKEDQRLTVAAPHDGHAVPAMPRRFSEPTSNGWQGTLMDLANRDCLVRRGDHLMTLHRPDSKTVTLFVGEREIEMVQPGQEVTLMFHQEIEATTTGTVDEIYEVDVDLNDPQAGDTGVETWRDMSGKMQSGQTPYRVTVVTESIPAQAFVNSGGRAAIRTPDRTLLQKAMELIDRLARMNL